MEGEAKSDRNLVQKGVELFAGDPVGDAFLCVAGISAVGGINPLTIGALMGGVYHIASTYKMNRMFETRIERGGLSDNDQIQKIENPIKDRSLVGRYTSYLWDRAKKYKLKKVK